MYSPILCKVCNAFACLHACVYSPCLACGYGQCLTMALGRGVVLTRPLPNKTPSVGMKQLKCGANTVRLHNTYG